MHELVRQAKSLDQLRGMEGDAANKYFQCFNLMTWWQDMFVRLVASRTGRVD